MGGLLGVGQFSAAKAITLICLSTIVVAAWCYPKGIGEDVSEPAKFLYFGIFGIVSLISVCNEKGVEAVLDFVIKSMEESRKRR